MRVYSHKFADPIEAAPPRRAERPRIGTFAKWQELLTREQYELVEVWTSQGTSRAMLFSRAMEVEQQVAAERERG
jgi:hypothetical protein